MIPVEKVHKDLPPMDPPVSVIVPYDPWVKMNPLHICRNDEVIFVLMGNSIGEKRIEGAKKAKNDWIVQIDADGYYPADYIPRVKEAIREYSDRFNLMMAIRHGGIPITRLLESGMTVKRDYFLRKTRNFKPNHRGFWTDVIDYFIGDDFILIPAEYYHPFSKDEKTHINALLTLYKAFSFTRTMSYIFR